MKKNVIYIIIALIVGLLAGFLIFGGDSTGELTNKDEQEHKEEVAVEQMWTCSMHPQIMQPEPGDCPFCGMDLIPVDEGAEGLNDIEIIMSKNEMELVNINT